MLGFDFCSPTRFVFGKGTESEAGRLLKEYGGTKVLLHYGGGSAEASGLLRRIRDSLHESGVAFTELGGVAPNPRLSLVCEGAELCRRENVDFILAVGGGSSIDSAKAISVAVPYEGDVWDFFAGKAAPKKCLPVGVVLTIAAAGSEGSSSAVITKEEGLIKRGLRYDKYRPVFTILNPELTFTLPNYQVACGIVDMLAHVFERYFTNTPDVSLTDHISEGLMRAIIESAPAALQTPPDYEARATQMWAGVLAHNGVMGLGREEDWATHQLEHELSGLYDVAHGAGLSVCFPAWMRYVHKRNVDRFCRFAVRVMDVPMNEQNPEETALKGIDRLVGFYRSIGMPVTLKELGVPDDRLPEMAQKAKCLPDGTLGSFMRLTKSDVLNIYELMR